ncbi:uncharacterized protein LOC113280583 [Papaver somniferum]|uniref:uncharacterized protein LOC113280583 n=1 Tax=Papaver somniferum TaxID=3469 RepID=UPI000E6F52C8|nr:uncharacterized protein LOC113280583 [Papaver somniferum]
MSYVYLMSSQISRMSYVVSSDYQRRLRKLEDENIKLKSQVSTHESDTSDLLTRSGRLEAEVSTYKNHITDLRKMNDQLVEIYSLSDEASSLFRSFHHSVTDDALLEHLNASLSNITDDKIKTLSLEDLKENYRLLNIDHRSALSTSNRFKRLFLESKERVKVLEARISTLITEKDRFALNGAKALKEFQEAILQVQIERNLAISKKDALIEQGNLIRSRLLIESDVEFEWAARVLDNARKDLAVSVSLESDHGALVRDILSKKEDDEKEFREKIESLEAKFSARNSKYRRLKKNLTTTVSNLSNDDVRILDAAIKKVCVDNGISPSTYRFAEVPPNEKDSDISDSEGKYEHEEIDEEGNDSEADEVNEEDTDGK